MLHDVHDLCCSLKLGPDTWMWSPCSQPCILHEYTMLVFVVYLLAFHPYYGYGAHLSLVGASVLQVHYGILVMGAMLVNYQGYYCTISWVWNCCNMDDAIPTTSVCNLPFILKFCSKCIWINARSYIGVRGGRVGVWMGFNLDTRNKIHRFYRQLPTFYKHRPLVIVELKTNIFQIKYLIPKDGDANRYLQLFCQLWHDSSCFLSHDDWWPRFTLLWNSKRCVWWL